MYSGSFSTQATRATVKTLWVEENGRFGKYDVTGITTGYAGTRSRER